MGKRRGGRWAVSSAAAGVIASLTMLAGCGNSYRPVVATIGVVGPAQQPTKYAVAISSPSPTSNGLLTLVDFSGDTILATTAIGVNPYYFVLNGAGTVGYSLNSDGTVTSIELSINQISSQVLETTLLPASNPQSLFATTTATYMADPGAKGIDQLNGTPPALKQVLPVASGYSPVYVVGQPSAARIYSLSQATGGGPGQVEAIETSNNTISNTIPVGRGPVYGVMSLDGKRAFVLNQGPGVGARRVGGGERGQRDDCGFGLDRKHPAVHGDDATD
jgi:hypothetical protein